MHDAVRVDIDELAKSVRPVTGRPEPALDTCRRPLSMNGFGVRDVDVHDSAGSTRVFCIVRDKMKLHSAPLDETVVSGLVKLGREAQPYVSREGGVQVVHPDDGSDAFEDHLIHDERTYGDAAPGAPAAWRSIVSALGKVHEKGGCSALTVLTEPSHDR